MPSQKASYLISLRAALHLAVLNLLIPLASRIGKRGLRLNDAHLDRILTQLSGIFLISGAALAFISPTPTLMVLSQVIATLGITFGVTARSVVTNLARQEDLGVVYTSISVAAYGGALVGGPFLAFLFGWGLRLGHMWTGMPFLGSVVLTSIALVAVSLKG